MILKSSTITSMRERPEPSSQLELNLLDAGKETQQNLDRCIASLRDVIKSDSEFTFKKSQIIELALKYPQGENACREVYKEKVGVSFRGFADVHVYDELVMGILDPEKEKERLRRIDSEDIDITDQGLWP